MKKVLFILAVFVVCLQINGFSQKSRVGVTAGVTSANMYGEIGGTKLDDDSKLGITFGMIIDAPIGKSNFSFQPGLHYVQKGRTLENTNEKKDWIALRYAELHANFLYNTNGPKGNFFLGGGPTVALDFPSAKVIKTLVRDPVESDYWLRAETNVNFGKESNSDFKGLDYGANMIAGYRFKGGFSFAFNYTIGLRNLVPIENGSDEIKNHCFGLRLGYLVNNK